MKRFTLLLTILLCLFLAIPSNADKVLFIGGASGGGGVSGPASSTDNAIPTWNGTGGNTLQDTDVTISGTTISGVSEITFRGTSYDTGIYVGSPSASVRYTLPASSGTSGQSLAIYDDNLANGVDLAWRTTAGSGDMLSSTFDGDADDDIDAAAGGTNIDTSASTGVPIITAGTWSVDTDVYVQEAVATGGLLFGDDIPDAAGEIGYTESGTSGSFGLFGANSEDLIVSVGDVANSAAISSNSGVTSIYFGSIAIETDELDLADGNITNVGQITLDTIDADGAGIAIGTGSDQTVAIDSSDWTIDATGIVAGIGNVTMDGTLDITGSGVTLKNDESIHNNTNGSITLLGVGGTNDEDISIDLDAATNNTVAITSSTGVDIIDFGAINIQSDTFDVAGAAAIAIGSADVTGVTITTDSTGDAEVNLPTDSIGTTEILDNTITTTDLAAILTFAATDRVDLAGVTVAAGQDYGLAIPRWANITPTTDKAWIAWDYTNNIFKVYDGGWVSISPSGAPTDAQYVTMAPDATLTDQRILTAGTYIDIADAAVDDGGVTVSIDITEMTGAMSFNDGTTDATQTWTWNMNAGTDPIVTFGNSAFNVSAGELQQAGNAVYSSGTTDVTLADGGTGNSLADPGADRILFWDDVGESGVSFLAISTGVTIVGTDLSAILGDTVETGEITNDTILAADLDATNTEADNDLITYDTATGGFTFETPSEIITAGTNITWSGTTLDVDDVFISNTNDDETAGKIGLADDKGLDIGTDDDWHMEFDEAVDNQLLFVATTGVTPTAIDDPMFEIIVPSTSLKTDQEIFGIAKGTQGSNTSLMSLNESGELTIAGKFDVAGVDGSNAITLQNNLSYSPTGNQLYFEGNDFKVGEESNEKIVLLDEDSATLTGSSWNFAGVGSLRLPTANADSSGEISINPTNEQLIIHSGTTLETFDFDGQANGYVLKTDGSGNWTVQADETAGSPLWSTIGNPTADTTIDHDAGEETNFTFTDAFTTGSQFLIQQTTGDPTGGTLFEVRADDDNVTAAKIGDGTNIVQISKTGALTLAGSASITAGNIVLGDNTPDAAGEFGYNAGAFGFFGANSESLSLTVGDVANSATISSGSGVTSINFGTIDLETDAIDVASSVVQLSSSGVTIASTSPLDIGATGVRITDDGDGALIFTGMSAGNDESLTWNFDDGNANQVVVSSASGVTEISFSAINMVTTGSIQGRVKVTNKSADATLTDAEMDGFVFVTSGATMTLPAVEIGQTVCVYSTTAAEIDVDPNASDRIRLDGTALSVGEKIYSAGAAGDFICLIGDSGDGWTTLGRSGTWTGE